MISSQQKRTIVACLGSSSAAAKGPYDWIGDLQHRAGNESLLFHRYAAGGDLAYNGLERMPKIIACQPDYVVILLGGNDVLASVSKKFLWQAKHLLRKHIPVNPSPEGYRENMQEIVHQLKDGTSAQIALISLPPFGENLGSVDMFQAELNQRFAEYNSIIKELASNELITYIPFYERMSDLTLASPGRAFTSYDLLPFYRDVFRQLFLRKSNDEIGRLNGWRFHRDGIHLNSVSGKLLADLVQDFLATRKS